MTEKSRKIRLTLCWLVASVMAFLAASIGHSQHVLSNLSAMGVNISIGTRWSSTLDDIMGLASSYLLLIALALALAFAVTAYLINRAALRRFSLTLHVAAGFLAIACLLFLLKPMMEITLLAPARTGWGFFGQCLAGALGGAIFFMTKRRLLED